ncbi:MAG: ORF6N domain-containing protein [Candidatus Cloacimonadota bacterium]|nr:MAG: ORF6N domain-containing protein [Candidatus Cloacimonadota bacterium]
MKDKAKSLIPQETIENKILLIRDQKVMLDRNLVKLYGVATKVLKQAVKRNIERFPEDFMFQLSKKEFEDWRSQIVTSNSGDKMGLRYRPYAFTQEGVAMLSSVLRSKRAIQVNIQIMRAFVKLRQVLTTHKDILRKIQEHDQQIKRIFEILRRLLALPEKPKHKIGFIKNTNK